MRVKFEKMMAEANAKSQRRLKAKDAELKKKDQELRLMLAEKDYQIQKLLEEKQELMTVDRQQVSLKKKGVILLSCVCLCTILLLTMFQLKIFHL